MTRIEKSKIIVSCLMGNILEWFDFAVYGYLAPIIATQFFPSSSKLASILLTYSVFAIGFIVRPLGAIAFGHIGDTCGRKTALVLSSFVMAIPTFIMGLLPNYASIGVLAPLLLIICRIFQGLSIGGEFTGSFVYLVEQGTPGKKGFFSCWADIGCGLGMILGSLTVAALHSNLAPAEIAEYGWRLPFLSGILLSIVAVFIRSQLKESPEFVQSNKLIQAHQQSQHQSTPSSQPTTTPFKELLTRSPSILLYATLLVTINALGFYTLLVFIPNQTVLLEKLPSTEVYLINTIILSVFLIATFIAAYASDYIHCAKLYTLGALGSIILAYPTFYALAYLSFTLQIITMCLMAVAIGFCFGPRPLFLVETFPASLRFSAIAIALNLGNAIFGGCAPLFATYLVEKTGYIESPAILIIISACMTLFAIGRLKKTNSLTYQENQKKYGIETSIYS